MKKRMLGILIGASLALSLGCAESYDKRVAAEYDNRVFKRDQEANTEEAPKTSNLKTFSIWIRPPKGLKGPAQTFAFVVEPNKFDVTDSFLDQEKQASLHIVGRSNAAKSAAKKAPAKGAPETDPTAAATSAPVARGDFTTDVLDLIKSAYSVDLDKSSLKATPVSARGRQGKEFKSATLELPNKQLKVYFYGDKNGPAQVALIFEGPKEALQGLSTKIDYSLNSLKLGPVATALYNGGDEYGGDEAAAPAPAVF